MELQSMKLADIHLYENNPRRNDAAIEAVAESIRQCGYVAPIIVDETGTILAGHARYRALECLGQDAATVLVRPGLTEEQKKKYRLLDNKTGELSGWDMEKLATELEGLDFESLALDWGISEQSYLDALEMEEFVDWEKPDKEQFSVTLNFCISDRELIDGFIKEKGKDYISGLIKKEAENHACIR